MHPRVSIIGRIFKFIATALLCAALLGVGGGIAAYLLRTSPKPARQAPITLAPLVRIIVVHAKSTRVPVQALGTVMPAVEVAVCAQVTGQVVAIHPRFHAGGIVPADAVLARIDSSDYELAVPMRESQVEMARSDLLAEQGQQEVARREWELLDMQSSASSLEQELALRQPQLRQKAAALRSAEASLALARLDLSRTEIKAPCNALLRTAEVNVGDLATPQKVLATLVGTDAFWVQASLAAEELLWLRVPRGRDDEDASPVRVHGPHGSVREGRIIALLGDLEPSGRMARVRIEVQDPLSLAQDATEPPLLLDERVKVEFLGEEAKEVFSIPRDALHDGNQAWVVDGEDRLQFKDVESVWSNEVLSLVRGLEEGDRVVVSDLAGPVPGMLLQIQKGDIDSKPIPVAVDAAVDEGTPHE